MNLKLSNMAIAIVISSIIFGYFVYIGLSNIGIGIQSLAKALNIYLKNKHNL